MDDPIEEGKRLYGIAEGKVDNWFNCNPWTVAILSGVAVLLVVGLVFTFKATLFCG